MINSELCSLEEKKDALDKALHSKTFARSEQLKAFLHFICEAETHRPGSPLTEYVIGVEVLGRSEGYSPAEDSSVRTRAYELRQKLDKLYSVEYPHEVVQITIPKGTYSPCYVRREEIGEVHVPDPRIPSEPPIPVPVLPAATKSVIKPAWIAFALLLAALSGSAVTYLYERSRSAMAETDPILAEAWGPMGKHDGTVLLSVATPLALVAGPFDHDVSSSRTYPAPPEMVPLFRQHRSLPEDGRLGLTFSDNMLAVGTMNATLTCANTLRKFGTSYQLLPERVVTVPALRDRSAILLGAPVDSEAVTLAMQDMPLSVDFEPSVREFVIRDRTTGHVIVPKKNSGGDLAEVYGLVTVRTSHDEDNRRIQTVLLSGITSVGTQGASEFFSSPAELRKFHELLARHVTGFPACYQVVIRCTINNALLHSYDYYTHRVVRLN